MPEPNTEALSLSHLTTDGRFMLGHLVLGFGDDHQGRDALSLWHVSPDGRNVGAWLYPHETAFHDPATARRILDHAAGRVVVAWETSTPIDILDTLTEIAGIQHVPHRNALSLLDLHVEIGDIRATYTSRINEERKRTKTIAPITWTHELPATPPESRKQWRAEVGLTDAPGTSRAAVDALDTAGLITWCVQAWRDTTAALSRKYLRTAFGEPRSLPPNWEHALTTAYRRRNEASAR